ncbi:MAG TPA: hypothetical protein VLV83_07380 [Acidobacteriota bacterium]|nr:hypothetical protein [Acidobacteriota bacterium]
MSRSLARMRLSNYPDDGRGVITSWCMAGPIPHRLSSGVPWEPASDQPSEGASV